MNTNYLLRNKSSDWWRNLSTEEKESNKRIFFKDNRFITYKDIDVMYRLCLSFLM
jgi:hypothetical protein